MILWMNYLFLLSYGCIFYIWESFFFFSPFLKKIKKKKKRVDLEQFLQVTSREGYFPVGKQTGMFQEET